MKIQVLKRSLPQVDGAQVVFTTIEHGLTYMGWFDKKEGVFKRHIRSSSGARDSIMVTSEKLSNVFEWFYVADKFPRSMPRLDAKGEIIPKEHVMISLSPTEKQD